MCFFLPPCVCVCDGPSSQMWQDTALNPRPFKDREYSSKPIAGSKCIHNVALCCNYLCMKPSPKKILSRNCSCTFALASFESEAESKSLPGSTCELRASRVFLHQLSVTLLKAVLLTDSHTALLSSSSRPSINPSSVFLFFFPPIASSLSETVKSERLQA